MVLFRIPFRRKIRCCRTRCCSRCPGKYCLCSYRPHSLDSGRTVNRLRLRPYGLRWHPAPVRRSDSRQPGGSWRCHRALRCTDSYLPYWCRIHCLTWPLLPLLKLITCFVLTFLLLIVTNIFLFYYKTILPQLGFLVSGSRWRIFQKIGDKIRLFFSYICPTV